MICKKCGANIQENSKFCGVCGEKVEEFVTPVSNEVFEEQSVQTENLVEEKPMVVPLIQPETETLEQTAIVEPIFETNENVIPAIEQPLDQTAVVEPIAPVVNESVTSVEPEVNNVPVTTKEKKKKNNAWIFVVLGALLGLIALALVYFAYSKSTNNSVRVLEKALVNMALKAENSGTIDAKLLIKSDTEDAMNLSATIKYAKQGDDNYNFNLTLNKSMLFDEVNLYASILDERATLYVNSSIIDMLGLTSSTPSMWVHLTTTEQELEMQTGTETDELEDIDLSDILDEQHFKVIGEQNDLTHYQLVIDNELINKIKFEASKEEDLKEFADSLGELTETYYVEFYINKSNELTKITMDLTNSLNDESIRSAIISFEFNNFGSTTVQIPAEAKNSIIDLETYMARYAIQDDTYVDPTLNQDYTYQF